MDLPKFYRDSFSGGYVLSHYSIVKYILRQVHLLHDISLLVSIEKAAKAIISSHDFEKPQTINFLALPRAVEQQIPTLRHALKKKR